ncbi:MAG: hypothetical protein WBF48_03855 [Halarcobacter sp.]
MNISTAFAPPFKLIAPFFILAGLVFVASVALLFGFEAKGIHNLDGAVLSWIHLFLLGFVMMVIFGAMAQLVPVVLEVGHVAVDLYYAIYPLLIIGTILMALGFYAFPLLLPFGGIIAFISFGIFLIETFLTILKVKKINFVIITVIIANLFLLLGLIVGIIMALAYAGILSVDIYLLLKVHVYLVFFGYVGITIMGMSLILLPMFWLSHNFTWNYVKSALIVLSLGIVVVCISTFFDNKILENLGYLLTILSFFLYFYQIFIIYKTRVRVEIDIYFKSMVFSYICLTIALILGICYLFSPSQELLLTFSWLIFAGYITFIISGHLYKIVPFLVWYERFSPYVGKRKVPMLADLIPHKSSKFQFLLSAIGVVIVAIGLYSGIDNIYKSGVSILFVGSIFLLKDILFMINFKEEKNV